MLKEVRHKLGQVMREVTVSPPLEHQPNVLQRESKAVSVNEFVSADPASVLLETRCFKETKPDERQCCTVLVKILYLLCTGQTFSQSEVTQLFFSLTQLFQSNHALMRRLLFLVIKTLPTDESEVFIITSSLVKDMNCPKDVYRGNAIRCLSFVFDSSVAQQMERHIKAALVDRNPFVRSAALVYAHRLFRTNPDIVKRWANEINEGMTNPNPTVQFHALSVLYSLKRTDRLALMKLLVDSVGLVRTLEDPAQVYLIGLVAKILQSARDDSAVDKQFLPFLENRLKSGSAMVKLEAAKCLVDLAVLDETSETTGKLRDFISLKTVVQTLNSLLSHPKTPAKFAAIRKISQLAQHRPSCVMPIVSDIEGLLNDSNRTVGTLALFTLLKTSQESNLERLLKHIQTVITEVSDPFKADIVAVVHELAVQYPAKQRLILNFLSAHLREESSTKVKTAIAESLMRLSEDIPACRSLAVAALSEFIEDCESAILCARIVSYLGRLAPQLENPGQVVRFIYNRLILENAVVRVSAVSALANVADECPSLREDLLVLLETTLLDVDDEVRSVSRIYLQTCSRHDSDETSTTVSIADALETDVGCSVDKLAAHLNLLYEQGDLDALGIINLEDLPTPQTEPTPAEDAASQLTAAVLHLPVGEVEESLGVVSLLDELNLDQVLPGGVSALGRLLSTGPPVDVTEAESEYRVQVFKHFFENRSYLLLEFQVTNTLEDQLLRNITADVTVQRTPTDSIAVVGAVPAVRDCGFDSAVSCFALLRLSEGPLVEVSLRCSLTYTVIEPNDEFEDDFPVNPFRLNVTDFIASTPFRPGVFRSAWKEAENYPEETLKLSFGQQFSSLQEAVTNLIHTVQLAPCDLSDIVDPTAAMTSVSLAGCVVGTDEKVLLKAVVGSTDSHGIVMKLAIRCGVPEVRAAFCKLLEA